MNAKADTKIDLTTLSDDQVKFLEERIASAIETHREMDLYRGTMRDIKKDVKDELSIPVKQFNALVKMRMQGTRDEFEEENEEMLELYDRIYAKRTVAAQQ
ncbi:MAG: hypothetical protein ACRDCE_11865 [Cetobacterium sp.]|uniref:hypothetical protein n=1 Tax=Cetobacterium sp. TaxID=2071632 RepID=UPI003EE45E7F